VATIGEIAKQLIVELKARKCICGSVKNAGHTFCSECYYTLPSNMRKDLYDRIGQGYEAAYARAIVHLKE
jgi:hypothetical protein